MFGSEFFDASFVIFEHHESNKDELEQPEGNKTYESQLENGFRVS